MVQDVAGLAQIVDPQKKPIDETSLGKACQCEERSKRNEYVTRNIWEPKCIAMATEYVTRNMTTKAQTFNSIQRSIPVVRSMALLNHYHTSITLNGISHQNILSFLFSQQKKNKFFC